MKNINKTRILITLIFLTIPLIIFSDNNINFIDYDELSFFEEKGNIKTSRSWGLTPFVIDDLGGGNYTWVQAALQDWCSNGSGIWGDPYIIENLTINGNNASNCLEIINSNVFFIINNCTFYNSSDGTYDAGIYLNNVDNGHLINNNISSNNGNGIYSVGSNNNTISGNNASNNDIGIYLFNSNYSEISQNNASFNTQYGMYLTSSSNCNQISGNNASNNDIGIYLSSSSNNTISGNNASYNTQHGMYLSSSSNNMILGNNLINNIQNGMRLQTSSNNTILGNNFNNNTQFGLFEQSSSNNKIFGNNASYNDLGIYFLNSNFNEISGNNVNNNTAFGIRLLTSNNNTIFENNANYNNDYGINLDDSTNNTISGNFIINNYQNGIFIEGSEKNIVFGNKIYNNVNLGVLLDSSSNENTFYENFFIGNGIHVDDQPSMNYWNSTTIGNYWDNYTGVDDDDDGIGDQNHNLTGGIDYLPICDDSPPSISIITPSLNFNSIITPPRFEVMIIDAYLDSMWYTVVGSDQNITFTSNGTINQLSWQLVWNGLSHGESITIRFYANDTFGHLTYQDITVIKFDPEEIPDDFPFGIIIVIIIGLVAVISGILMVKMRNTKKDKSLIEENDTEDPNKSLTALKSAEKLQVKERKKMKDTIKPIKAPKLKTKETVSAIVDIEEEQKVELEETEAEVDIEKQKFICVVHKGLITGSIYLCPNCQTFYCVKCAKVLKKKKETCWSCNQEFKL